MVLSTALLILSFACGMLWETPFELPFEGIAINAGSSVLHLRVRNADISFYRSRAYGRPARFWEYAPSPPDNAWVAPMWAVSLALAAWPAWWLVRSRHSLPAAVAPHALRRAIGALLLSHWLASYGCY